jgi:hypothetical protein
VYVRGMNTDAEILADKRTRIALDGILRHMKAMEPSRERALAITKVQEAIMWLGMDLKRIGNPDPYPDGYVENTKVAPTADGLKL